MPTGFFEVFQRINQRGAYDLPANSYVVQPVGLDQFVDMIRQIGGFWLRVVKLPEEH